MTNWIPTFRENQWSLFFFWKFDTSIIALLGHFDRWR